MAAPGQGVGAPLHGGNQAPEGSDHQAQGPAAGSATTCPSPIQAQGRSPGLRPGAQGHVAVPPSCLPTAHTRPSHLRAHRRRGPAPWRCRRRARRTAGRPRQPPARRLAPSRGGPPARGGAGALAEGRRRRRLRGLTKPTGRRSAIYSAARVVMETHQLKPAAIGSVRASPEEGGGARWLRPTRGRTEGRGARAVVRQQLRAPPGPPPASRPSRPCGALAHAHYAAGRLQRPRTPPGPEGGTRTRTRTTPRGAPGGPTPSPALRRDRARAPRRRSRDLSWRPPSAWVSTSGAGACPAQLRDRLLADADFQHLRRAELFFHLALYKGRAP